MTNVKRIKGTYLLQKFSGKGGWTYIEVPEVKPDKNAWFGEVEVSGQIDDYRFTNRKLLPLGNGRLFLPVNAEIRKKILKQAGDLVDLELHIKGHDAVTPDEIIECFENEPTRTYQNFLELTAEEKKSYLDHISEAKSVEVKVQRIIKMMNDLSEK